MSAPPRSSDEGDGAAARKAMLLRLDPVLHAALARWAADELRSTNAHVEWLLRGVVERAGRLPPPRSARPPRGQPQPKRPAT